MNNKLLELVTLYLATQKEFDDAITKDDDETINKLSNIKIDLIRQIKSIDEDIATAIVLNIEKLKELVEIA